VGYPATASGVEIKILEKMFTQEEAEVFLNLTLILETSEPIAERTGKKSDIVATLLEQMTRKGLVFSHRKGAVVRYAAIPFVLGIYEYQVGKLTKEVAQYFEEYLEEAFYKSVAGVTSLLRPIPVNRSINTKSSVATFDDALKILQCQKKIVVADCICQTQQDLIGQGCEKPMEVCFVFDTAGLYYVDTHMGREISLDEAEKILKKSHAAGLVMQPAGAQNLSGMCNCCGDCCAALRAIKKYPKPAEMVSTNYFAITGQEECKACEVCVDRCQMDAIAIGECAAIDLDRCIGCGLCVSTCPAGRITLQRKSAEKMNVPPKTGLELMRDIARTRGKDLTPLKLRS